MTADLAARLQQALATSRKAQDKPRTLLLGTVLAAVKNRDLELGRAPSDEDVLEVLRRGVKTRRESVEQYRKGGREDLALREEAEIRIISEYLPPDVSPDEIRSVVREVIAAGVTDLGRVMGQVMPKFKGRADGKVINQIVREELQAG